MNAYQSKNQALVKISGFTMGEIGLASRLIIIIVLTHCSNDHTSTRQSTSQDDISSQRIHKHCKPAFSVGSPHQSALSTVPFISLRHLLMVIVFTCPVFFYVPDFSPLAQVVHVLDSGVSSPPVQFLALRLLYTKP